MNLYELNQAGYNSLPAMTGKQIEDKKNDIHKFLYDNRGESFILVCNELKYYTIFNAEYPLIYGIVPKERVNTIMEVILELGTLKAIEINESMIEFWISKDNECHMYAFFNYDKGVIKL